MTAKILKLRDTVGNSHDNLKLLHIILSLYHSQQWLCWNKAQVYFDWKTQLFFFFRIWLSFFIAFLSSFLFFSAPTTESACLYLYFSFFLRFATEGTYNLFKIYIWTQRGFAININLMFSLPLWILSASPVTQPLYLRIESKIWRKARKIAQWHKLLYDNIGKLCENEWLKQNILEQEATATRII